MRISDWSSDVCSSDLCGNSPMPRYRRGFDTQEAFAHLARRDRKLGKWMKRIGPIDAGARWRRSFDPVDALARAILYQQQSGKPAATIGGRVEQASGSERFQSYTLGRVDDAGLRACGVSGNKTLALRDLALRESRGEIPDLRRMSTMAEDDIIAAPVPIRGIGRWTVEMMLMFRLGRADVLPVDDLGIRTGAQEVDRLEALPTPKALAARRDSWGPSRTSPSRPLRALPDTP